MVRALEQVVAPPLDCLGAIVTPYEWERLLASHQTGTLHRVFALDAIGEIDSTECSLNSPLPVDTPGIHVNRFGVMQTSQRLIVDLSHPTDFSGTSLWTRRCT